MRLPPARFAQPWTEIWLVPAFVRGTPVSFGRAMSPDNSSLGRHARKDRRRRIRSHRQFASSNPIGDTVRQSKIEWIGVRHEEGAALAATGQAKTHRSARRVLRINWTWKRGSRARKRTMNPGDRRNSAALGLRALRAQLWPDQPDDEQRDRDERMQSRGGRHDLCVGLTFSIFGWGRGYAKVRVEVETRSGFWRGVDGPRSKWVGSKGRHGRTSRLRPFAGRGGKTTYRRHPGRNGPRAGVKNGGAFPMLRPVWIDAARRGYRQVAFRSLFRATCPLCVRRLDSFHGVPRGCSSRRAEKFFGSRARRGHPAEA